MVRGVKVLVLQPEYVKIVISLLRYLLDCELLESVRLLPCRLRVAVGVPAIALLEVCEVFLCQGMALVDLLDIGSQVVYPDFLGLHALSKEHDVEKINK